MAIETPQFRMAQRLAGGKLAELLARYRNENRSFDEIARLLYAEHGIEVTRQTIARWTEELGISAGSAA